MTNKYSRILLRPGLLTVALSMAMLAGCAPSSHPDATSSSADASPAAASASGQTKHAECLVCKKNADLACIDVDVDKATPTALYNGQTYYFCSQECKHDFEKNPTKYVKK